MSIPPVVAPALPRAHVLNYITSANTPTRVRELTAKCLGIIGGLWGLLAAGCVVKILLDVRELYDLFGPGQIRLYARLILQDDFRWIELFFFALTAGVTFFGCARPVGRARKEACVLALIALGVTMLMVGFAGAIAGVWAFDHGLGLRKYHGDPVYFLWLLGSVVAVLLIAVLNDIFGYVRWILKNPRQEKPPVAFLQMPVLPGKPVTEEV